MNSRGPTEGPSVMDQNQGPDNKFDLIKSRYILPSLLGYLD
jgi:hypothetical protein